MVKKIRVMTAALAGAAVSSQAAITVVNTSGATDYDSGEYELFIGDSSNGGFSKSLGTGSLAQTITVTNAFELGAVTLLSSTDGDVDVTDLVLKVFQIDDPTTGTIPTEGALFSGTFDSPATGGNNTLDSLFLQLNTNISLAADSYYMIVVDGSGASNDDFNWRRTGSSAGSIYDGGQAVDNADRDFLMGLGLAPVPTANNDEYILPYGVSSTNVAAPGVLANDIAYDSAVLVTNISSGSLTLNADGSFECSGLVNGTNTFSYAVVGGSETSTPASVVLIATLSADIPIAVDDAYAMDASYVNYVIGNVLNNDTNTSATLEMFALADDTNSLSGTLSLSSDGAFTYTPTDGFVGTNSFTYVAYTVAATSSVATVTLTVEESGDLVIDSFENYDNSSNVDVRDNAASNYWDAAGSGAIEIRDYVDNGSNYQYMYYGWDNGYRGAKSTTNLYDGISASSDEMWIFCEINPYSASVDGLFGLTANETTSWATAERGDYNLGVRFSGDGTNITLYAVTGGDSSTDVLLTNGLAATTWHGLWLNINNAASTFDVYIGGADDFTSLGTQVGTGIAFTGAVDLPYLQLTSHRAMMIDNIMEVNPDSFVDSQPADLFASSLADNDTIQLSISLNARANAADYWPISCDNLAIGDWAHVAHSDAPDGTFAVTNLNLASGDSTNKVIYVKTTNTVEFICIENNE